jgi:GT2 family glycosyltransferase
MCAAKIAVLMICHNRKDTTLACLRELMSQAGVNATVKLQIYLVNAGSTDGTIEAIQEHFPAIHLIRRGSDLFWCGGMRVAFDEAMKGDHDYFLWLNDDTILLHNALQTLLDTAREVRQQEGKAGIIVGSMQDPKTGQCTYGGIVRRSKWRPLSYRLLEPSGKSQRCLTMNGNCVLIAREVVESIGNLSPEFTHAIGDIDYGLRASAKGIDIWIVPTYIGECSRNPLPPWTIPEVSLKKRLEILHSPKGLPPREYLVFIKRHAGIYWPVYFLELYMRVLFPRLWRLLGKEWDLYFKRQTISRSKKH